MLKAELYSFLLFISIPHGAIATVSIITNGLLTVLVAVIVSLFA